VLFASPRAQDAFSAEEVAFPPSYRGFDAARPVRCNTRASGVECCTVPVLACKQPRRLVGLGDKISASGLAVYM
jgi:hypothetical protein